MRDFFYIDSYLSCLPLILNFYFQYRLNLYCINQYSYEVLFIALYTQKVCTAIQEREFVEHSVHFCAKGSNEVGECSFT